MKNKLHLNLLMIMILILIIVMPNYSHAVSASDILNANLSNQTMSTLKEWHTQVNSRI